MASILYRNVRPEQEDLIATLTARYADQKIRFDTGFYGNIPVQACGRIGRRYFYFRFRGDSASLTIGAADLRGAASRAKHSRRLALRKLRRSQIDDGFFGFLIQSDLRRDTSMDRHPSRALWYAVLNDVTGERYAGNLAQEEAAELFIDLMGQLQPAATELKFHKLRAARRGPTAPSDWKQGIIRKPSKGHW
ncbi:hypothetical protein IV500_05760 [Paeniglutamicibacter antarcticus]|uniref:Uncharacterized protein n=1 Tax=Arthrobacter terrae TaxID=2935737 RepID=A0A931G4L3_9MICC|nr:hypothetical protein [Arthrobacter terrae]MBG0738928.1 hypothetical protein [Arthrobacter terrae]